MKFSNTCCWVKRKQRKFLYWNKNTWNTRIGFFFLSLENLHNFLFEFFFSFFFLSLENLHNFLFEFFFPSFFCLGACGFVLWTLVWIFIRLYYSALIVTEDNLMLFLFMREGVIIMVLILLFRLYLVDLLPLFLIN